MYSKKLKNSPFSINCNTGHVLLKSAEKPPEPEESSPKKYPIKRVIDKKKYNSKFK